MYTFIQECFHSPLQNRHLGAYLGVDAYPGVGAYQGYYNNRNIQEMSISEIYLYSNSAEDTMLISSRRSTN